MNLKLLCVPELNNADMFFTYVTFEFTQMSLVFKKKSRELFKKNFFLLQNFGYAFVFLFKLILIGDKIFKEQHAFPLHWCDTLHRFSKC